MKNNLVKLVLIFFLAILQGSVGEIIFFPQTAPFFLLLLIFFWSVSEVFEKNWIWVVGAGFFWDLISFGIIGKTALFFLGVAYFTDLFLRRFFLPGTKVFLIYFLAVFWTGAEFLWNNLKWKALISGNFFGGVENINIKILVSRIFWSLIFFLILSKFFKFYPQTFSSFKSYVSKKQ